MSIENDFDQILRKTSDLETAELKREALRNNLQEIGKFLKPPYTFDLPPPGLTRLGLHQLDPHYHYLCRNNSRANIIDSLEMAIRDQLLNLTLTQQRVLQDSIDRINQFPRDVNRTDSDMLIIKQAIEGVLNELEKNRY